MKLEITDENKLKDIVKEAVKDALEEEIMKLRLLLMPFVSDEEQKEIEESYGTPSNEAAKTLTIKD